MEKRDQPGHLWEILTLQSACKTIPNEYQNIFVLFSINLNRSDSMCIAMGVAFALSGQSSQTFILVGWIKLTKYFLPYRLRPPKRLYCGWNVLNVNTVNKFHWNDANILNLEVTRNERVKWFNFKLRNW